MLSKLENFLSFVGPIIIELIKSSLIVETKGNTQVLLVELHWGLYYLLNDTKRIAIFGSNNRKTGSPSYIGLMKDKSKKVKRGSIAWPYRTAFFLFVQ